MHPEDSLDRLRTLTLLCQQLSHEESDRLMRLAIDDPRRYAGTVAALCSTGQLRLPVALIDLLQRDLGALPVAV